MKISKIASLAILGISLSTSAFADISADVTKGQESKYVVAKHALDVFFDSIDFISSPENAKLLKTFSANLDSNEAIKAAFNLIATLDLEKLAEQALPAIKANVGNKEASLVVSRESDNKPKLVLSVGEEKNKTIINGGNVTATDFNKLFAKDNKEVLEALIKNTKVALEKKVKEFREAAITANVDLANTLATGSDALNADQAEYIAANIDILKAALDEKFKDSDKKARATAEKKFSENIIKKAVVDVVTNKLLNSSTGAIKEFKDKIEAVTGIDVTDSTTKNLNLSDSDKSKKILEISKRAQKALDKIVSIQKLNSQVMNAEAEVDETAKKKAKFNVMKKAVELGIAFKNDDSSVDITAKNINDYNPDNGSKKDKLGGTFGKAKTAITTQVTSGGTSIMTAKDKAEAVIKWFDVYSNIKAAKADLISDYLIAGADNKALAKALSGAVSNKAISEMLTDLDLDKTEKAIESLAKSVREVSDVIANNSVIDGVSFANNLATATRLAKLSNPFNDDLALAYAIKNIKNDSFADNSGDLVNSTIKAYTDRYNNDNNVWGTLIGAKGHIKNAGNPEFYGLSLGYDKRLDNTILGGFVSYAKSKLDTKLVSSEADNYQLGAYSRTFIDNHEIDAKASFTLAKNSLDRTSVSNQKTLKQNANFDSYLFNLKADYGYVVGIDDALFLKPTIGLEYSYAKNKEFKESGDIAFNYHGYNSSTLALNAALEIRQYVNNSNFLYFTPGVSTQLYKSNKDLVLNVVGSNVDVTLPVNSSKQTFFTLNTGADIKLTDALSTNINFGVKASNKEQYYNGTLGLKYQF